MELLARRDITQRSHPKFLARPWEKTGGALLLSADLSRVFKADSSARGTVERAFKSLSQKPLGTPANVEHISTRWEAGILPHYAGCKTGGAVASDGKEASMKVPLSRQTEPLKNL